MKKLFTAALAVLICAAMLAACEGKQAENEAAPQVAVTEYENFTVEETEGVARVFDLSGGRLGDNYDSFSKLDISRYGDGEAFGEPYYVGTVTDGTRISCDIFSADGYFSKTEEVPNTKYRIHDKYGVPVTDIYFEDFAFSEKDTIGNEGFDALYACLDGSRYCYELKNGKFILKYIDPAGETGKEAFGLKETQYYYTPWQRGFGINGPGGNVLIEPIHSRVDIPTEDRLIIYTGYQAHATTPEEHMAHITDLSGNIFASYSFVKCVSFDSGSVWIAYYCGDERSMQERYNSADGALAEGFWFVDKDGQIISERFLSLDFRDEGEEYYEFAPESPDDTAVAVTESGETVKISIEEYICEP